MELTRVAQNHPSISMSLTLCSVSKLINLQYTMTGDLELARKPNEKLTNIEENVLRYLAGYVCYKIQSQLEKSKKLNLLFVITDTSGCEMNETKDTEYWTNILDHGGLWHVSDTAYSMFCAMENELQQHLTIIDKAMLGQNRITILVNKLALNTEVLFHWNEILEEHSHVPEEEAALLLRDIIKLFVTTHGFAYATSLLKVYKQVSGKSLQKTKGLQKSLHD